MTYELGIIGGGNMGGAIVRGAISAGVLAPEHIVIAEPDDTRRRALDDTGVVLVDSASEAVDSSHLMLAVKPQIFPLVAAEIGMLSQPTVVISIMAGLGSAAIRSSLGDHARVIRVMPNTPCQVGCGATAIACGAGAEPGDDDLPRRVFDAIGLTVTVREDQMYAVTAVSGSGPAYIFRLAEAMEQAALSVGLDPDVARTLVEQTVLGAGRLLSESDLGAGALRQAVTSPRGTTAAALDVMNGHDIEKTIIEAITAARDRGIELDT